MCGAMGRVTIPILIIILILYYSVLLLLLLQTGGAGSGVELRIRLQIFGLVEDFSSVYFLRPLLAPLGFWVLRPSGSRATAHPQNLGPSPIIGPETL